MEIERFKSKLSKSQLEGMAIDTVKKQLDNANPLDIYSFSKKLLFFANVLVKEAEDKAKEVWDQDKEGHPEMSYTQGGTIYEWMEDPVYESISIMMAERLLLLKTAVRTKDPFYDKDGVEVPKCKIKGYRKDSISVKI